MLIPMPVVFPSNFLFLANMANMPDKVMASSHWLAAICHKRIPASLGHIEDPSFLFANVRRTAIRTSSSSRSPSFTSFPTARLEAPTDGDPTAPSDHASRTTAMEAVFTSHEWTSFVRDFRRTAAIPDRGLLDVSESIRLRFSLVICLYALCIICQVPGGKTFLRLDVNTCFLQCRNFISDTLSVGLWSRKAVRSVEHSGAYGVQ